MDFITSTIISGAVYDIIKHGLVITSATIKEKLGRWITQDSIAAEVAEQLSTLGITDELSPVGIERRVDAKPELCQLIERINSDLTVSAPSTITTVNQTHSGSGDNVAGNKISYR